MKIANGQVIYDTAKSIFQFVGDLHGASSVLMCRDFVQLEIDEDGRAQYIWGFAPQLWWAETTARPPQSFLGNLTVELDDELIPGISVRVPGSDDWEISFNRHTGWVCFGTTEGSRGAQAVEFATNTIAVVHKCALEAIWLRPELN